MTSAMCERFALLVRSLPGPTLRGDPPPHELLLERDGDLSVYYAPFDVVNPTARLAIVGITPGLQQMQNALVAFRGALDEGVAPADAARRAKQTGSFSGPLRSNLVAMLDHFRINEYLGIRSCASLFGGDNHLVHCTSALQYPVFRGGKNYNGSPKMTRHPMLRRYLIDGWGRQARLLPEVVWVPLGGKVAEAAHTLIKEGVLDAGRVLEGLEHPSGANNERINYLVGRKERAALSRQTDPDRIDRARVTLEHRVAALMA